MSPLSREGRSASLSLLPPPLREADGLEEEEGRVLMVREPAVGRPEGGREAEGRVETVLEEPPREEESSGKGGRERERGRGREGEREERKEAWV